MSRIAKRKIQPPKAPSRKAIDWETRNLLATNVERRMNRKFENSTNKPLSLAKASGLRLSRVQDLLNRSVGPSADTVGKIARGLDCPVYELFVADTDGPLIEIASLLRETDELGQENVVDAAKKWRDARPKTRA